MNAPYLPNGPLSYVGLRHYLEEVTDQPEDEQDRDWQYQGPTELVATRPLERGRGVLSELGRRGDGARRR